MKDIGKRVKELRNTLKMKQVDFAKRVLVSSSYISKIESGKESPSEIFVKLISLEFNISYEWLRSGIGGMDIKKNEYDYFERNTQVNKLIPEFLFDFSEAIESLNATDNNFRTLNINGILLEITGILNADLPEPQKDLLLEITASYIGELRDFVERLKDIETKSDTWEDVSNYYISSAMKSIKSLLADTLVLYRTSQK